MSDLIEIGGVVIHADAQGRFSINDLHRAAGGEDRHKPGHWLATQQTRELIVEIETGGIPAVSRIEGRNGGTYGSKEMIYSYAMWVSAKFHLQVIRTFDAVATGRTPLRAPVSETADAAKLFPPLFRVARLIGCDKQAAAISANQAVQTVSGQNLLALMGQTHLIAENQEAMFFTPTELGSRISLSARKFNLLLAEAGFQAKRGDEWEVLDAGKDFARIYDTGKKHGSGVPIQQIKWAATVLPLLKQGEEA